MPSSTELYKKRINKVIDHINSNLDHNLSLEELAAIACFSPFHFHRLFKSVTGETVKNFTNRIRMEKAARLLRFSENKLRIIASECEHLHALEIFKNKEQLCNWEHFELEFCIPIRKLRM
ncbi:MULTISPECIES: AraC family transcriptional regulator [Sphingobacterium]|jgi:AraC family transcriptional regulator|uniref:AraC family transcriptional regulator n=1 Tax=Sphingobacterium TaxID=28453 RepID=UPI000E9FBE1F|nr:AraC family transcriptional regulator [Sphingobacterium multivorum]HAF35231.1 AraC family transcriptional regulator [Sphingobacterium sp.]HAT93966.1 AraC family transcriptional regulator [Sphingobacterium sp.]HBI89089.1 AraC family transcriptional regulator [Sphingobacterium sp.]